MKKDDDDRVRNRKQEKDLLGRRNKTRYHDEMIWRWRNDIYKYKEREKKNNIHTYTRTLAHTRTQTTDKASNEADNSKRVQTRLR